MSTALTETERHKLNDLESIIEKGLTTFVEVGAAVSLIRDQRLYRETHSDFETYCRERWGWNDRRASQLIQASEVVGALPTTVGTLPANEAQARVLTQVPTEQRSEVWEEAVQSAPVKNGKPKPTAADVRRAVNRVEPIESRIRRGMEMGGDYLAASKAVGVSATSFRQGRHILMLSELGDLSPADRDEVEVARAAMNEDGHTSRAYPLVQRMVEARWGDSKQRQGSRPEDRGKARMNDFMRAYGALVQACVSCTQLEVPLLSAEQAEKMAEELREAGKHIAAFRRRIEEAL